MRHVFNELSARNIAPDIDTAHLWLTTFFSIGEQSSIRSQETISIASTLKFSEIHFHEKTSFTNWIRTIDDIEFRRRILAMITKEPIKNYPYYYYEASPCQGLGEAFENDEISISYGSEHWPSHELNITREQFNKGEEVEVVPLKVKHIASMEHLDIYLPERKFRHNPKHDRVRPIANKGETVSILDCSHERAYKLLCSAIGEHTANDRRLFNFDTENRKYIIFYRHDNQEYHAYHTDNENEIPQSVKIALTKNLKIGNFYKNL